MPLQQRGELGLRRDAAPATRRTRKCSTWPATTIWACLVIRGSSRAASGHCRCGGRAPPGRGWSPGRPNCTPQLEARARRVRRRTRGAGLLLGLSGQPRRAHRAGRPGRHDRLRRGATTPRSSTHAGCPDRRWTVVPHRDLDKIDAALVARRPTHALVVTDAVFSVDGDLAPIAAICTTIARRHGAILVVDEAHALGVVGERGQARSSRPPGWRRRRTSCAR